MEDLKFEGHTYAFILKKQWLEHLTDFGITEEDFKQLGERINRVSLDIVIDIITEKNKKK